MWIRCIVHTSFVLSNVRVCLVIYWILFRSRIWTKIKKISISKYKSVVDIERTVRIIFRRITHRRQETSTRDDFSNAQRPRFVLQHRKPTFVRTIPVLSILLYLYVDKSTDEFHSGAKNNTEILEPADPSSVDFTNKTASIELGNESGPFISALEARVALLMFYLPSFNGGLCSGASLHMHLVCKETLRVVG